MTKKSPGLLVVIIILIALALWVDYPNSPGIHINTGTLTVNRNFGTHYGLDLVGGVQALLEADLPQNTPVDAGAMSSARAIVESRVNGLGVTEAVVQQVGDRRILVEIPGETDPEKALSTIRQTGLLEFVDFTNLTPAEAAALDNKTVETDFGKATAQGTAPTSGIAPTPAITSTQTITPTQAVTSTQTTTSTLPGSAQPIFHTVMTGAELTKVNVTTDQTGKYQVAFELSSNGAKIFRDFTSQNVGKILAIILDKRVISTPSINTPITDGKGVISGNFTADSANNLAVQLRYGSLPIPLKVVSSQTVGPTLGQISLQKSLLAGLIGLSVVGVFMALYYRLPGVLADLALVVYALLTLALFKLIPVTLTLPGIAGYVLSVGMAVDANVLIFERLKEELRAGRTLRQAIDMGWGRAWPSIRDSNFSTLITCLILFWFGNAFGASIVKGFSLTLAIGVLISMFTAILVTRSFLHLVLDNIQFGEHHAWFGI
jgi:preprotein translocase subunit SecD